MCFNSCIEVMREKSLSFVLELYSIHERVCSVYTHRQTDVTCNGPRRQPLAPALACAVPAEPGSRSTGPKWQRAPGGGRAKKNLM